MWICYWWYIFNYFDYFLFIIFNCTCWWTIYGSDTSLKSIFVIELTERLESKGPEKQIIKRIIGFGGERVTVLNGRLFINDTEYIEGYLSDELSKHFKEQSFTIVVPDGYVFVMGDNRDISKDSRSVGCFKLEAINGVILR